MLTENEKSLVIQLVYNWIDMSIIRHSGENPSLAERAVYSSLWDVCQIPSEKFEDVEREILTICYSRNQESRAMGIIDFFEHNRRVIMEVQEGGFGKRYFMKLMEKI